MDVYFKLVFYHHFRLNSHTFSPSRALQLSQVARDQYEALIEHIESEQQQQS